MDITIAQTVIAGVFGVVVTLIPVGFAYYQRRRAAEEARLRRIALEALQDVQVLYAIEAKLLDMIHDVSGQNMKHRIRQEVEIEQGLALSGKYTPGRLKSRMKQLCVGNDARFFFEISVQIAPPITIWKLGYNGDWN